MFDLQHQPPDRAEDLRSYEPPVAGTTGWEPSFTGRSHRPMPEEWRIHWLVRQHGCRTPTGAASSGGA
jgi:hypothetical protein